MALSLVQFIESIGRNVDEYKRTGFDEKLITFAYPDETFDIHQELMLAAATFSKEGQDDDRSSIIPVKISPPKNVGKVTLAPVPKGAIVLQSILDEGNDSSSQNPQHYLANFLNCLLRLLTADIGAALRKPLSLWPEHMLQQLSSRAHL